MDCVVPENVHHTPMEGFFYDSPPPGGILVPLSPLDL